MSEGQRFRRRALRRGYKVDEVDAFLDRVEATLAGDSLGAPVAAQEVHDVVFRVRFGGYDEWQVDLHLDRVERQLADAEERGGFSRGGPQPRQASPMREDRFAPLRDDRGPQMPSRPMPAGGPMMGNPMAPAMAQMSAPPLPQRPLSSPPMPSPMSAPTFEAPTFDRNNFDRPMFDAPSFDSPMSAPPGLGDRSMERPMSAPPLQARPMNGPPPGYGHDDRGYPGDRFGDRSFTGEPPVVDGRSFTGERPVVDGRSFTGERPVVDGRSFTGERPMMDERSFTGERPMMDERSFTGERPVVGDNGFSRDRGFGGERGFTSERPHLGPPMPQVPMSPVPGGPASYDRFDDTGFTPGGFGNFDMPNNRHGRGDMTSEIHMPSDFGQYPGGMGSPSDASPVEVQRIDALRRTFTPRRFGSGYDAHQVNRLFDAIIASLSGRSGMPIMEAELDPNQFSLVPGGYFEAEVEQALRQVRELIR